MEFGLMDLGVWVTTWLLVMSMVWHQVFMWKPRRNEMQSRLPYEALVGQTDEVTPVASNAQSMNKKTPVFFLLFDL